MQIDITDVEPKEEKIASEKPAPKVEFQEQDIYDLSSIDPDTFTTLDIGEDPAEFISFFDKDINNGSVTLYPWQVEIAEELAHAKATIQNPYKLCVCAANGSGKDAYVIAPFASWFICTKKQSIVVITSASAAQMTNQTERHIKALCQKINNWSRNNLGKDILIIRQRHITCILSGSEIFMFATDDALKAEGYHPNTNSEMAIIVNEAKTVSPEIFGAMSRCTGNNYLLYVSTPGEPRGIFHSAFHDEDWHKRHITYYDCLRHQSKKEFEKEKITLGEHDPLFRSKWLALFTDIGGKNIINRAHLDNLISRNRANLIKQVGNETRIGLDIALSTHGDETVLSIFKGNRQTHIITLRNKDAVVLAENIDKELKKLNIPKSQLINADDGGVGRGVLDCLQRIGYERIRRVMNQSKAKDPKNYRNRGAELWYRFEKLIRNYAIILLEDPLLLNQIASRKFKDTEAGLDKLQVESKESMKSEGLPSPDRADATVLAVMDIDVEETIEGAYKVEINDYVSESDRLRRLQQEYKRLGNVDNNSNSFSSRDNGKVNCSLNTLIQRKQLRYEKRNRS